MINTVQLQTLGPAVIRGVTEVFRALAESLRGLYPQAMVYELRIQPAGKPSMPSHIPELLLLLAGETEIYLMNPWSWLMHEGLWTESEHLRANAGQESLPERYFRIINLNEAVEEVCRARDQRRNPAEWGQPSARPTDLQSKLRVLYPESEYASVELRLIQPPA